MSGSDGLHRKAAWVIWLISGFLVSILVWASFAELDEVASGTGRVIPAGREQVIQSLDGGILAELLVREDEMVAAGQVIARLEPTRMKASLEEAASKYRAAEAQAARLAAEVNGTALQFPATLAAFPELAALESRLFDARKTSREASLRLVDMSLKFLSAELQVAEGLQVSGAASRMEVLHLQRQQVELEKQKVEVKAGSIVKAYEELASIHSEMAALASIIHAREDALAQLTIRSPVAGVVKNLEISTIGGVIPPNGKLMHIVPMSGEPLIEARLSPRDIAFIHPGQPVSVKVTSYDYAIYGGLEGVVETISPDSMRDEIHPDSFYYRVFVRTRGDAIVLANGKRLTIAPGMVATVDVHTGRKTVLDYLVKPFNKAGEALRER